MIEKLYEAIENLENVEIQHSNIFGDYYLIDGFIPCKL
jgi:hypothetical protein